MTTVLMATLGSEPQVITIAAHLLMQRGPLDALVILHTREDRPPIDRALPYLRHYLQRQEGWPETRFVPMAVDDIRSPRSLELFSLTLFQTLKGWAEQGARIRLLLAGGRKPMAMLGMSVAQMVLDVDDQVLYLFSDDSLRHSGRMVPQPEDHAELINIPLPRLSAVSPTYTTVFQAATPADARATLDESQRRRLDYFVEEELTSAERNVVECIVRDVVTVEEIAAILHKSPKTVANQLNSIYKKLEVVFDINPNPSVKREFLRLQLTPNFEK